MIKYFEVVGLVILTLFMTVAFGAKDHATVVNKIKVGAPAKPGVGTVLIKADGLSFAVKTGKYHPHPQKINIQQILIQTWQLGDDSWYLFKMPKKCTGPLQVGQQLRIKGSIKGKKLRVDCKITSVKD